MSATLSAILSATLGVAADLERAAGIAERAAKRAANLADLVDGERDLGAERLDLLDANLSDAVAVVEVARKSAERLARESDAAAQSSNLRAVARALAAILRDERESAGYARNAVETANAHRADAAAHRATLRRDALADLLDAVDAEARVGAERLALAAARLRGAVAALDRVAA